MARQYKNVSTDIATAATSNNVTTAASLRPVDQNGEPEPLDVSEEDGPAAAAIVVVVDDVVVEVLDVLDLELVVVARCVVVV